MDPAAGQIPDQPCINGSKEQFTLFGPLPGVFHVIQNPFNLCPGKISIRDQPRCLLDKGFIALCLQILNDRCCSSALPDNGIVNRFTRLFIPDNRCLTLIGNTDAGNILRSDMCLPHGFCHHILNTLPDFHRIMFHPPRIRKNLSKLFLRHADNSSSMVK